jgi:hypothetical protein
MTTPVGPLTPYVTPAILLQAPTGLPSISWNSIPSGSQVPQQQKTAELWNIAQRASSQADSYCNQILRATLDTEYLSGPDYYATVQQSTGNMRLILSRWPVTSIVAVSASPNCFPRSWTSLPAGYWDVEMPTMGVYGSTAPTASGQGGQAVIISPQAGGGWCLGRNGYRFQVEYTNGWPHCGLTEAVDAGATMISVDDCTGWAITSESGAVGATGNVYDPGGQQEVVQVTASTVTAGPGTLTLASALTYNHPQGTLVSTMPASMQWAVTLFSTAIALTRGATATSIHTIPGAGSGTPAMKGPESLVEEGELLLHGYRRTI